MAARSVVQASVQRQFGKQATHYARSRAHAEGTSLPVLVRLARPRRTDVLLDVATGTGFTAFAFAPHVAKVMASDLTMGMLTQARRLGAERGLRNVLYQVAEAEALPYRQGSFGLVTCRIAPHHFSDVPAFLKDARRVLRPGGILLVADTVSPAAGEVQEWHNLVERLRDPSHVRNYTPAEWKALVEEAGLTVEVVHTWCRTPLLFSEWVKRSGTPAHVVEELRALFASACEPVSRAFRIVSDEADFRFSWLVSIVKGRKEP